MIIVILQNNYDSKPIKIKSSEYEAAAEPKRMPERIFQPCYIMLLLIRLTALLTIITFSELLFTVVYYFVGNAI
ncbi:MAG: hypothetical protein WBZ36_16315 [Candidatus Nitrosopolaris sp.]